MYNKYFKRILDFILSIFALFILSPVLLVLALLIRLKLGSPVLFKQKRPGKYEKIFTLYKFRTMTDEKAENGELLPDNVRLTRFGRFLRSSSLDELPELLNIIKGNMSIVGPRPLLVQYLQLYNTEQKRRHLVRPGLTGWAQINGRNAINWEEKFKLDIWYVDNMKLFLDIKIICQTVIKVFKKKDINNSQNETMPFFTG